MSSYHLGIPIGLYALGWGLEFVRYWRAGQGTPMWSGGLLAIGWGLHTFLLAYGVWSDGVALAAMLSAVAWLSMIVNYAVHLKWRNAVFGFILPPFAIAMLLSAALLADASFLPTGGLRLDPGLWRVGLIVHIVSILAGHLLFAMACLFSIAYLYQEHRIKAKLIRLMVSRLPSLSKLDRLNHRAIALGFFFLSVGILLGIGAGGMQDLTERTLLPRLLLPMGTWLVYAAFLLQRTFQGQQGRITAIWSIAGFLIVMTSLIVEIHNLTERA